MKLYEKSSWKSEFVMLVLQGELKRAGRVEWICKM